MNPLLQSLFRMPQRRIITLVSLGAAFLTGVALLFLPFSHRDAPGKTGLNSDQMKLVSEVKGDKINGSTKAASSLQDQKPVGTKSRAPDSTHAKSRQSAAVTKVLDATKSQKDKDRLEAWEPFDYLHDSTAPVRFALTGIAEQQKRQQNEGLATERQRLQEFQAEREALAANLYQQGRQFMDEADRRAQAASSAAVNKWRSRVGGNAAAVGVLPGSF